MKVTIYYRQSLGSILDEKGINFESLENGRISFHVEDLEELLDIEQERCELVEKESRY